MHEFTQVFAGKECKTCKAKKPKFFNTPDGTQWEWEVDSENPHKYRVQVPELALIPSDPTNRMTMMMEFIEKRWVKASMPIFLKFLAESKEIRLKYLEQVLGDIFSTPEIRRAVVAYMRKMGGLLPASMSAFKRSGALNEWLKIRLEHSGIDISVDDPAVSLSKVVKAKQKQAHEKLLPAQIKAMDRPELHVYITARKYAGASPEEIISLNETLNRLPIPELGPSPF